MVERARAIGLSNIIDDWPLGIGSEELSTSLCTGLGRVMLVGLALE